MTALLISVCGMTWAAEQTGTITFGSSGVRIDAASVTGKDDLGNSWTITTEGTTSFTANSAYYQVGSSSKPASSITFTTTLPNEVKIESMTAKFGGFNSTAGNITLKVGNSTIGTGSLNASNDVVINSTSTATGKVLTVTVTNIKKGVKCYYISYTYSSEEKQNAVVTIGNTALEVGESTTVSTTGPAVVLTTNNASVASVSGNTITAVGEGTATITATWEESDEFNAGSKTFEVSVTAQSAQIDDDVFDFSYADGLDYGSGLSPKSNTEYGNNFETLSTWVAGNVTMVVEGNHRWWIATTENQLRLLSGSKATISVPEGYVIKEIVFTANGSNFNVTADCGELDSKTWTGSSQSVEFTRTGNCYITSITVTYEQKAPTTVPVTIPASGWASYCSKYDVVSTGQCYMATKLVNGKVTIVPVEGTIKAGTGMLVNGSGSVGSVELAVAATAPEAYADMKENKLVGVLEDTDMTGKSCYILSDGAFYRCTGGTLAAGKAYLDIAPTSAKVIDIDLNGDETAISTVNAEQQNGNIYTINGIQVKNTQLKGIYIINGKKVVK